MSATASASVANSTKAFSSQTTGRIEAVLLIEAQPTDAFAFKGDNPIVTIYKTVAY